MRTSGHDFGKYPLQNGSNTFNQFIRKSAQFFNIIKITEIDPLEKELVFQNNIKEGRLKLLNRNTTCVKKISYIVAGTWLLEENIILSYRILAVCFQ